MTLKTEVMAAENSALPSQIKCILKQNRFYILIFKNISFYCILYQINRLGENKRLISKSKSNMYLLNFLF